VRRHALAREEAESFSHNIAAPVSLRRGTRLGSPALSSGGFRDQPLHALAALFPSLPPGSSNTDFSVSVCFTGSGN
jgi:hypothetical protein